ncbi:MAG: DUF6061 family protein [Faecousia sp.]
MISCEFNIDTACVEVKYADGSMIAIDCTLVETEATGKSMEAKNWIVLQPENLPFALCKRQFAD